jgi:hypothetical protein
MIILGYILLWLGCLTSIVGDIMFLAVAYKRNLWWFFGCLFIPIIALIFFFLNLKAAAKPFIIFVAGLLMAWLGAQLVGIDSWKIELWKRN